MKEIKRLKCTVSISELLLTLEGYEIKKLVQMETINALSSQMLADFDNLPIKQYRNKNKAKCTQEISTHMALISEDYLYELHTKLNRYKQLIKEYGLEELINAKEPSNPKQ